MHAIALALGLVAQDAAAQPGIVPPEADSEAVLEEAPPVSAIALELLSHLPATLEDWDPEGREGALALQYFSMVGREDLVERYRPEAYTPAVCPAIEDMEPVAVLDAARDAQIVIINEAHNQPLHRYYIANLARDLAPQFDVYAAETFNYVRLIEPRAPGPLGFYDREPVFYRSVETIEEVGYRLVAYEIRAAQRDPNAQTRADRIAVREEAQADNLIAEVLATDPDARILVHVGYSHVLEAPDPQVDGEPPLEWFALRLKQKTGIDPLTISQTHCSLAVDETEGDLEPSAAARHFALALADPSSVISAGAVDFALARPPMQFEQGRPAWRFVTGDFEVSVPDVFQSADRPVVLEARLPNQPLSAMPVDRLLLYPGDAHPLLLPRGQWVITAWTSEGAYGVPVTAGVSLR